MRAYVRNPSRGLGLSYLELPDLAAAENVHEVSSRSRISRDAYDGAH